MSWNSGPCEQPEPVGSFIPLPRWPACLDDTSLVALAHVLIPGCRISPKIDATGQVIGWTARSGGMTLEHENLAFLVYSLANTGVPRAGPQ